MSFDIIVAVDRDGGISRKCILPWTNTCAGKRDMAYFADKTKKPGTIVIMGHNTWKSLPIRARPLRGRINVIVAATAGITIYGAMTDTPVVYVGTFDRAVEWSLSAIASQAYGATHCYVIGGANIYAQAFAHGCAARLFATIMTASYDCDCYFPLKLELLEEFLVLSQTEADTVYNVYNLSNSAERAYQALLANVLREPAQTNRTAVMAHRMFSQMLRFPLYERARGHILPLLTTKKMYWPAIYHELIWFIGGSTDIQYLAENNVNIWNANTSRAALDARGLDAYDVGELGPGYGYQWRHWGAPYKSQAQGHDQLAATIEALKADPYSRRHIITAWNPDQIDQTALPPCHYAFQFYVDNAGRLCCQVNMRSSDLFLGLGFNMASYGLLTHIIAAMIGRDAGELSIVLCDAHIYETHVAAVKTLLLRTPRRFPTIRTPVSTASTIGDITNKYTIDDYIIGGYMPHARIAAPMVV